MIKRCDTPQEIAQVTAQDIAKGIDGVDCLLPLAATSARNELLDPDLDRRVK